jgi:hypothetical protein
MTLNTSDLVDALRLREVQIDRATISENPKVIGIAGKAIMAANGRSTPIEINFTPLQASTVLALLMGLQKEGHIPQPEGKITRHRNQ